MLLLSLEHLQLLFSAVVEHQTRRKKKKKKKKKNQKKKYRAARPHSRLTILQKASIKPKKGRGKWYEIVSWCLTNQIKRFISKTTKIKTTKWKRKTDNNTICSSAETCDPSLRCPQYNIPHRPVSTFHSLLLLLHSHPFFLFWFSFLSVGLVVEWLANARSSII